MCYPLCMHASLDTAFATLDALEAHLSTIPPLRLHAELGEIIAGLRAVLTLADDAFAARLAQFSKRLDAQVVSEHEVCR